MGNLIDGIFDNGTISGLSKALDLNRKRNEALVSNIANAETPQYRAVDVTFAGELAQAFGKDAGPLEKTDAKHLDIAQDEASHLIADYSGATRADGNNVDLDAQMGKLAVTGTNYSIAANLMRRKLQGLRQVISDAMR